MEGERSDAWCLALASHFLEAANLAQALLHQASRLRVGQDAHLGAHFRPANGLRWCALRRPASISALIETCTAYRASCSAFALAVTARVAYLKYT
eukprot:scaffold2930_cov244-Pinguiococcus_pyrenoidosus.AAC.5